MHPDRTFAWLDEAAMRAFVRRIAFAHIAVAVAGVPMLALAPLSLGDDGAFLFHLSRRNALAAHLDGAIVAASIVADDFYLSPDWYGTPDEVPTWNYRAVEIQGRARRLDEAELAAQVDALSAAQEALLLPKPPWTSAKMTPARLAAMLRGIAGFAIEEPTLRGTAKFGQNKSIAQKSSVTRALRLVGRDAAAEAMEAAR